MREYSTVSPKLWTGRTGKAIRGDREAQIVAFYLMTCVHSNMVGFFHCPIIYISHETGIPLQGALEALQRLQNVGFCTYEEDIEHVWVHEMARFQIADQLKPNDKQAVGVQREFDKLPESGAKVGFYRKYKGAFFLQTRPEYEEKQSPLQAPCKPLLSPFDGDEKSSNTPSKPEAEADTDSEADTEADTSSLCSDVGDPPSSAQRKTSGPPKRAFQLPKDWQPTSEHNAMAAELGVSLGVEEAKFRDYYRANGKPMRDWNAAFNNWLRNARQYGPRTAAKTQSFDGTDYGQGGAL